MRQMCPVLHCCPHSYSARVPGSQIVSVPDVSEMHNCLLTIRILLTTEPIDLFTSRVNA